MSYVADAWVLPKGDPKHPGRAELTRKSITVPSPGEGEVIAAPLYGCWEGNMGHALHRKPVDVCRQRGEDDVVLGNAGVVRVLEVGRQVTTVEPGQVAIVFCVGETDRFGYPIKILGYDAVGSQGVLATRMRIGQHQLIPIPVNSRYAPVQWAAFSLRYVTAWSNWELAHGTFRLLIGADEMPAPHAWGWGGGVTLAELDLARRHGFRTVMLSGNDAHIEEIRSYGVDVVDRRSFGELQFDEERYRADHAYRASYHAAESAFLDEVRARTGGEMVQIFVDLVGLPVHRPTLKALSRQGVITTAGWKEGMKLWNLRAIECIERHQHVHTHYARYAQGVAAVAYAEEHGWLPKVEGRCYAFDEVPELAEAYERHETALFPCFAVAPD